MLVSTIRYFVYTCATMKSDCRQRIWIVHVAGEEEDVAGICWAQQCEGSVGSWSEKMPAAANHYNF